MPTIRQLEYLVAIADVRHFRRAAERVNTTQPTLSGQLKALEERIGVVLVERSRSRVSLTPVGSEVVEIARRILRDTREIRAIGEAHQKKLSGIVRLGLPPSIGPYLVPRLIPDVRREFPDLKFYAREDASQVLPNALADGTFDIIITMLPVGSTDSEAIELYKEPVYLAVPIDHPLAKHTEVSRADLRGLQVLTLGPAHGFHHLVRQLCEESGARIMSDYEGTSLDALREMVGTGLGVSFFPGLYIKTQLVKDKSIRTIAISGKPVSRTVGMAWRKTSSRRERYSELARFIVSTVDRAVGKM